MRSALTEITTTVLLREASRAAAGLFPLPPCRPAPPNSAPRQLRRHDRFADPGHRLQREGFAFDGMSGPARAANCSLQREGFAFDGMYAPGPLDPLLTSAWVVCTCLACFTTIASTWQICQHLEAGRQVTRSLYPGAKTFYTTRLLAVLPICAATSALTLFVPGLRVFFAFVQTSAVAVGLRYFGWLTAEMMGGRGRLMRDLEALPPSRWWARPPCCFVWGPMWFAWPPQVCLCLP